MQVQKLYKTQRKQLAKHILLAAPLEAELPSCKDVEATYEARFSRESPPDPAIITNFKDVPDERNLSMKVTIQEVMTAQKDLKAEGAAGPDKEITTLVVKKISPKFLVSLFNIWKETRRIPQQLKECRTTLIPKGKENLHEPD